MNHCIAIFPVLVACTMLGCISPNAGGGTDVSNARIAGIISTNAGDVASRALVKMIPAGFDPLRDTESRLRTIVAGDNGEYAFDAIDTGMYSIEASWTDDTRALVARIRIAEAESIQVPVRLRKTAVIAIPLGENAIGHGYVYVPGTTFRREIRPDKNDSLVMIDSVPAGVLPAVSWSTSPAGSPIVLSGAVAVEPGDTARISHAGYRHGTTIFFDHRLVRDTVTGCAVPVHLTNENFDFSDALENGGDLRLENMRGKTLGFDVDEWDVQASTAVVWVYLDTLVASDHDPFITMRWGGPVDSSRALSEPVFGDSSGYARVYHFGNDGFAEASGRGAPGSGENTTASDGVIGTGIHCDHGGITMDTFDFGDEFTISLWFKPADSVNLYPLVSNSLPGSQQPGFRFFVNTYNVFDGRLWFETANDTAVYSSISTPGVVAVNRPYTWQYLCVSVRRGAWESRLYVDGVEVSKTGEVLPDFPVVSQWFIGRFEGTPGSMDAMLDEVQVSKSARSAAWIRLCHETQRPDQRIVSFERIR